jgi:hypothetical protein
VCSNIPRQDFLLGLKPIPPVVAMPTASGKPKLVRAYPNALLQVLMFIRR